MPKRSVTIDDTPVDTGGNSKRQKRSSTSPPPPPPLTSFEKAPLLSPSSHPRLPPPTADDWKLHLQLQENVFTRAEGQRRAINEVEKRRRELVALSEDIPRQAAEIQSRLEELHSRALAIQAEYAERNAEYE